MWSLPTASLNNAPLLCPLSLELILHLQAIYIGQAGMWKGRAMSFAFEKFNDFWNIDGSQSVHFFSIKNQGQTGSLGFRWTSYLIPARGLQRFTKICFLYLGHEIVPGIDAEGLGEEKPRGGTSKRKKRGKKILWRNVKYRAYYCWWWWLRGAEGCVCCST